MQLVRDNTQEIADRLEEDMRKEFLRRYAAQQAGHTGDIVPRAMAHDYPAVADGSVPYLEQK